MRVAFCAWIVHNSRVKRPRFSILLGALIDANFGSQSRFARASGIEASTISRQVEGKFRCSHETLHSLCQKVSNDPSQQYELLVAHLLDEAEASGLPLAGLVIRAADGINVSELDLAPELNANLGLIAQAAQEIPEVSEMLDGLAGWIARYRALQADHSAAVSARPVDFATELPGDRAVETAARQHAERTKNSPGERSPVSP